jgi:hypothetical protein
MNCIPALFQQNGWILGGGDRAPARGPRFGLIVLFQQKLREFTSLGILRTSMMFSISWSNGAEYLGFHLDKRSSLSTLKKAKRKFDDTQIIFTTLSKINQIQNIIQISI